MTDGEYTPDADRAAPKIPPDAALSSRDDMSVGTETPEQLRYSSKDFTFCEVQRFILWLARA